METVEIMKDVAKIRTTLMVEPNTNIINQYELQAE